jgi:hypothetical protein
MSINRHHLRRPKDTHIKCSKEGCINYYSILQRDTEELCKPCRQNKKRKANNVKDKSK